MHTGELLFCSVLKYGASRQLGDLHRRLGNDIAGKKYSKIADYLKRNIPDIFASTSGLFHASTAKSSQRDVWGSAFAVYIDAIEEESADRICRILADAYIKGTLSFRGNIRHVLTTDDFSENTVWELTVDADCPKNRYQNGAYWSTPAGWVCYAIAQVDEGLLLN